MRSQTVQVALNGTDQIVLPANPNRVSVILGIIDPNSIYNLRIGFGVDSTSKSAYGAMWVNTNAGFVSIIHSEFNLSNVGETIKQPIHASISAGQGTLSVIEGFV